MGTKRLGKEMSGSLIRHQLYLHDNYYKESSRPDVCSYYVFVGLCRHSVTL